MSARRLTTQPMADEQWAALGHAVVRLARAWICQTFTLALGMNQSDLRGNTPPRLTQSTSAAIPS